jgi:hypothetical protein
METIGAYHMRPPRPPDVDYNCPTEPWPDLPFNVVTVERADLKCGLAQP